MKKFYRVFSLFLALMLCVSLLPVGAMALETVTLSELLETVMEEQTVITENSENGEVLASGCNHENLEFYEADYTECRGGWTVDYYVCDDCGLVCDANGAALSGYFKEGNGQHEGNLCEADYTECNGGFTVDYYICDDCGVVCDASNGEELDGDMYYKEGNGQHTPGIFHEANYTECGGGWVIGWYSCSVCGYNCDENGDPFDFFTIYKEGNGQHAPGRFYEANYTECNGGWTVDFYICADCWGYCDADGVGMDLWTDTRYKQGNGQHRPGELCEANYTECGGGWIVDFYICADCDCPCDADGVEAWRSHINGMGHNYLNGVCTRCGMVVGDIDGDGYVLANDLVSLMKSLVSGEVDAANDPDLNEDGIIDILDVIRLVRIMAGLA